MALALLTSALLGIISLIVTMVLGFLIDSRPDVVQHFLIALFTTFVAVLAQCMSIFYFIGTAKQVKDLTADRPEQQAFIQRTRQFKSQVFPPATWAIVFTMAAFIIGAGVDTRVLPVWSHSTLAILALGFNLYALVREVQYMARNNILLDEVAVLVGNAPEAK
jgi:hypothetical protein